MTRRLAALAFLCGLAACVALIAWLGAGAIAAAIVRLGWRGFLLFSLAHAPVAALLGAGWRVCLPADARPSLLQITWARILRDAGGEVLPFSQIGGYVIGARAAMMAGISGAEAAASTLADLTTEAVAQLAFTALGIAAFAHLKPGAALIRPALLALMAIIAVSLALAASLRGGGWLSRLAAGAARRWFAAFGEAERTWTALRQTARRRGALAASLLLHLIAWLGAAWEAWLALRLMDAPISAEAALALESLLFAARSVGFLAPNGIGVQEGAYALLAPLVGLAPADALALSLVKRARDLAIGAPALLLWQRSEIARAWRKSPGPAP